MAAQVRNAECFETSIFKIWREEKSISLAKKEVRVAGVNPGEGDIVETKGVIFQGGSNQKSDALA